MISSWRNQIFAALHDRDLREKANIQFINEYTRLADRAAHLQNTSSLWPATQTTSTLPAAPVPPKSSLSSTTALASASASASADLSQSQDAAAVQIRLLQQSLIEAQQARNACAVQLKTTTQQLQTLTLESTAVTQKLEEQRASIDFLEQKLGNRNDEKVVNRKVVEDLQDEILALNIQLNLMDQAKQKLRAENDELIRRWKAIQREK